jgi:hypothetical protein
LSRGDIALAHARGQTTLHDLNETFQIAKVDVTNDTYLQSKTARWPERPVALKNLYTKYYLRIGALATNLMRLSALALGLPGSHFDDKVDGHISRLNVRLYLEQRDALLPGQLRAGAHTDYGTVTNWAGWPTRNGDARDLTHMYGPAVCSEKILTSCWRVALHQCIRPLIGHCAPGRHGYQRACINGNASIVAKWVTQHSYAPGRPNLHLI